MMPLNGIQIAKPDAPSNPKIVRGSGTDLKISWDPSTDHYHKKYKLHRSNDNFVLDDVLIKTTSSEHFTDGNLCIGEWYYNIKDVDINGNESERSVTASYIIKELLPFTGTFVVTTGTGIVTKNINTVLGRNATSGTVLNEGDEIVSVELSYDGITYVDKFNLRRYEILELAERRSRIAVHSMKFTSVDTAVTMVVT